MMPLALRLPLVGLLSLAGLALALRIALAQGGMWLDEAWSAVFAEQARTPAGVFLAVHHDNSHHLNTLWMQWVGMGAPPLVQRALAIVSSTLAVLVAGFIGWRRSLATGLATASLFAVSPMFVTYGAEARGYATMTLAALVAILLIDQWLEGRRPPPRLWLGLCFAVGALAQLTALFVLFAIGGWVLVEQLRRDKPGRAVRVTVDTLMPAGIVVFAMFLVTFVTPFAQGVPMLVGARVPYSVDRLWNGLSGLFSHVFAMPAFGALWPGAVALGSLAIGVVLRLPRRAFYCFAILVFPVAMAIAQPSNANNARYYLIAAMALLLLWGDVFGWLWVRGSIARAGALALAASFAASSLHTDLRLIADARGNPDAAARAMQRLRPEGARVLLERTMGRAVQEVAARQIGYRVHLFINGCAPADFLIVNRFRSERFGDHRRYCGQRWAPVMQDRSEGMIDEGWRLYRRVG